MRAYNANAAQKPRNQRTLPFHILISCILDLYIYILCCALLAAMGENSKKPREHDITSDSRRDAAFGYAAEALCSLPRRCS